MRDLFPEYYGPGKAQLTEAYQTGSVVLDANVLLSLYRVSAEEREEVLAVLLKVGDRLWVPHQAALEYQRSRLTVIQRQAGGLPAVRVKLRAGAEAAKKALSDKRAHEGLIAQVSELLDATLAEFEQRLEKLEAEPSLSLPGALWSDPVRDALDGLLAGKVGEAPSDAVLRQRTEEAAKRYESETPPGYLDSGKEAGRAPGDYLLWAEVLEHASQAGRAVLLVTNDQKADWFLEASGHTVGPRLELVCEMRERTPRPYVQHTLRRFLELAGELLATPVPEATIEKATRPAPRWTFANNSLAIAPTFSNKFAKLGLGLSDSVAEKHARERIAANIIALGGPAALRFGNAGALNPDLVRAILSNQADYAEGSRELEAQDEQEEGGEPYNDGDELG